MAFGERLGGLGTLHTAAPPPHFPILAFHCWIGFQLNNTSIVHECVNIKQQWSKSADKYVLDYSEVLHLRQPISDQKNETPKKTQLRPPRTPPRLRQNHQPTITQKPTNHPAPPAPPLPAHPPPPAPRAPPIAREPPKSVRPEPVEGPPRTPHRTRRLPNPFALSLSKGPHPQPQQHSPSPTPPIVVPAHPHSRHSCEGRNPEVRGAGRLRPPFPTTTPHPPTNTVVPAKAGTQGRCAARGVPTPPRQRTPTLTRAPFPNPNPRATLPPWNSTQPPLSRRSAPRPQGPHRRPHALRRLIPGGCLYSAKILEL